MSSEMILPVTQRLPASRELWDDTNLPLCAVVTPGAVVDTASKETTNSSRSTSSTRTANTTITTKSIPSLSTIPKCLNCGAPHPTRQTHFRPMHHNILLCYLCGKTSSTLFQDQQEAREMEIMDKDTYDHKPPTNTTSTSESDGVVVSNTQTFQIPLYPTVNGSSSSSSSGDNTTVWSAPAMACPPVWWIVLDASLTKKQSSSSYWNTVGSALEMTLKTIPSYVHVGLIAANSTQLSTWDLSSPVPHVTHYDYTSSNIPLSLTPADALHKSNIYTALRAITDAQPGTMASNTTTTNNNNNNKEGHDNNNDDDTELGMVLGLVLEVILEFMEQAKHPGGKSTNIVNDNDTMDAISEVDTLRYAGGKILCLLGNPPLEIDTPSGLILESQPPFYQGGVAGACFPLEEKFLSTNGGEIPKMKEPTDLTPSNLKEYLSPLDPEDSFVEIGSRCAKAALGVDILVVVSESAEKENDTSIRPFFGLPLLRLLSDSSGAPGPLMFATSSTTTTTTSESIKEFQKQLMARTPWQADCMFGAQMRARISPGFTLEDAPIAPIGRDKLQLAPFLSSQGLSGPAVAVEKGLWVFGSCDSHTSVVLDFETEKVVKDVLPVDGFGEVVLKPVLQVCVAYTSVELDPQTGEHQTVRKMKISSVSLPLAQDVEPIYDTLDPEALTLVLFQKLQLNAMQEGLVAAQDTAENWLKALLVCLYQSAQVEQAKIEEQMEKTGSNANLEAGGDRSNFIASERLLDIKGELSDEDVLLGKGHEKLAVMSMLTYALLQCDALRPTSGSFRPSLDARAAAMSQMSSMTPTTLSKCIAPCIQLWSHKDDEVIFESVDLNREGIQSVLTEFEANDAVFFVDSPQQIILHKKSKTSRGTPKVEFGTALLDAVDTAAKAYRTKPAIHIGTKPEILEQDSVKILANLLVEDQPTYRGVANYKAWCTELAAGVRSDLKQSGDLI